MALPHNDRLRPTVARGPCPAKKFFRSLVSMRTGANNYDAVFSYGDTHSGRSAVVFCDASAWMVTARPSSSAASSISVKS